MPVKSVTSETIAQMVDAKAAKPEPAKAEADAAAEISEPEPAPQPEGQAKAEADPKKPRKGGVQERIEELLAKNRETEEFAQSEYEARLQAQRRIAELEALQAKKPEEQQDKRPDRSAYKAEEAEKYEDDLLAWNRRQAIKEFQAEEAKRQQDAALRERTEQARHDIADFDDVISAADRRQENIPGHVAAAIIESDKGPHLAYYLAKNPAEAKKIFAMTPAKALLALGKIETTFAKSEAAAPAETAKTAPKTTQAPPPLPSLAQGSGTIVTDVAKAPDFATYKRMRLEQMRAARR